LTRLEQLGDLAPEAWKTFVAFDAAAFLDQVIPQHLTLTPRDASPQFAPNQ
jgi:hypothetical protein